jgi:hypothetical protein
MVDWSRTPGAEIPTNSQFNLRNIHDNSQKEKPDEIYRLVSVIDQSNKVLTDCCS